MGHFTKPVSMQGHRCHILLLCDEVLIQNQMGVANSCDNVQRVCTFGTGSPPPGTSIVNQTGDVTFFVFSMRGSYWYDTLKKAR